MRVKAVLFDFDMTLINSVELLKKVRKDFRRINKINNFPELSMTLGMSHKEYAKKLSELNKNLIPWYNLIKLDSKYMKRYYKKAKIIDINDLAKLQNKGIMFGVVTNNSKSCAVGT